MSPSKRTAIQAGVAAQIAGAVWILQWGHALVAHGPTSYNEAELWLGMTWFDSAKFLALSYVLLIPGILYIGRGDTPTVRVARIVAVIGLVVAAVATTLEFRLWEWGTYAGTADSTSTPLWIAGPIRGVTSALVLPAAVGVLGVRAARGRAMPSWLAAVLIVGFLATFFIGGPLPPLPGLVWLVLGAWLLSRPGAAVAEQTYSATDEARPPLPRPPAYTG